MKKKLTGAVAASLVAGTVAPAGLASANTTFTDIDNSFAKQAILDLAAKGIVSGKGDGKFDPTGKVTREEFAAIVVKTLGLDTNYTTSSFSDVSGWSVGAVEAAYKAGLIAGRGEGKFDPKGLVTREEAAAILVNALKTKMTVQMSETASFADFGQVSGWAKSFVATASKYGLIKGDGVNFNPKGNAERQAVAALANNFLGATSNPQVASVKAVNEKTLELTGTGLLALKAEDITLSGNVVASLAGEGTKLTVTFENTFPVDTEQTLTVKQGTENKEFKFTYGFTLTSVELKDATYDDDTAGQVLAFTINGSSANTNTEFLRQAGYTVNFVADSAIFAGPSTTSSTGVLDTDMTAGKYSVQIQISKGGVVVVSDTATITIADVESTVTAITSATFTNAGGFDHVSTTLVTGESATITALVGNAAGKTGVALNPTSATVESSNPAIISVSGQTLTANAPGTATITVKLGSATKTYNFTVANTARKVAKATPSVATVKLVADATPAAKTIQITTVDQYGDPIAVDSTAGDVTVDLPKDASLIDLVTVNGGAAGGLVTLVADGKPAAGFVITPNAVGNGTILIKDASNKTIGQIAVQVSNVDNVASEKVEYTYDSRTSNSFKVGEDAKYQVSQFNSSGYYNGAVTLNTVAPAANQYFVESADPSVATVAVAGTELTVTGVGAGTTAITFKDSTGMVKHQFNVTISEATTTITKVNFKATSTLNFAGSLVDVTDVLDVRADGANDAIVYGIEHNEATAAKVRVDDTVANELILYIDADNSGTNNAGDIVLGAVTAEILTGATGGMAAGPIDLSPGSYTTAAGHKGTILFRVIVDADASGTYDVNEAISTTVINVDVN